MFTRLMKDYGLEGFDTERSKGTFACEVRRTLKIDMGQAGKYRLGLELLHGVLVPVAAL